MGKKGQEEEGGTEGMLWVMTYGLETSCNVLGSRGTLLEGLSNAVLKARWGRFGASGELIGDSLGRIGNLLGASGGLLGHSWDPLGLLGTVSSIF